MLGKTYLARGGLLGGSARTAGKSTSSGQLRQGRQTGAGDCKDQPGNARRDDWHHAFQVSFFINWQVDSKPLQTLGFFFSA
jgi:hypothetical protein